VAVKAYVSVIKSGCRFQDELVKMSVEINTSGSAPTAIVSMVLDRGDERDAFDMTESIRKKEKAVKASFKI